MAFVVVALARAGGNLRGGIAKSVATAHSGNASREYLSMSHGNGSSVGGTSDENLTVSRVVPVADIAIPSPASSVLLHVATQGIKCQEYYRSPGGPFRKENIYNFGCEGSSNCCFYRGPSGGINFCDICTSYSVLQNIASSIPLPAPFTNGVSIGGATDAISSEVGSSAVLRQGAMQDIKCQDYYRSPGGPFKKENIYNFGCEGSSNCCFYRGPSGSINFCDTCVGNAFLLQAGQPEVEPDVANGTSANESLNAHWFVPVPVVVMPPNAAPRMPGQIMPPIAPAAGPVVVPPVILPGTLVPPSVPVIGPVVVPPVMLPGVPIVR